MRGVRLRGGGALCEPERRRSVRSRLEAVRGVSLTGGGERNEDHWLRVDCSDSDAEDRVFKLAGIRML